MEKAELIEQLVEMIRRSSTSLPSDVRAALAGAIDKEKKGSTARSTLKAILDNVKLAEKNSTPVCQDTGTLIFHVSYGPGYRQSYLREVIHQAVRLATERCYLRPNTVNAVTGQNVADNVGKGSPYIEFSERDAIGLEIALVQKGGGCENVSSQYSLPNEALGADRDLEGVRRVTLDAIHQAQGRGCSPGILGVCVGGDRGSSYVEAKAQLFRPLDDSNDDPSLAALEARLLEEGNQLGIGPMGFGGATTLLGVKIGSLHRLPASYFVSIAYMCWACRRGRLSVDGKGEIIHG